MFVTLLLFLSVVMRVVWPLGDADNAQLRTLIERLEEVVVRFEALQESKLYVQEDGLDDDFIAPTWENDLVFEWMVDDI